MVKRDLELDLEEAKNIIKMFLAASKCDPNKNKYSSGKWLTVNVRKENYDAAVKFIGQQTPHGSQNTLSAVLRRFK